MARHLQRHCTLPVIQPKAKEQILMNVLHALARELTKHRSFQHTPLIVKGGTGLALGYGLTRPSTDLDITCGSGISKEKVVDVAYALLSRDHNRKITRADVNQKGRGYVRLNWTDHEDGKEIHHETKVDVNVNDDLGGVTNYEIRNEIRVLNIWNIADSKLDTLTGERPREQARDMYDAAWLMHNHMEVIAPWRRLALRRLLDRLSEDDMDMWEAKFIEDDIISRVDFNNVWLNLNESLEFDPVVLHSQYPNGALQFLVENRSCLMRFIGCEGGDREIGVFDDIADAQRWLGEVGSEQDLPAIENTGDHLSPGLT